MEKREKENDIFEGIIINNKQRKLFFDYLGLTLKLPKVLLESSGLTALISLVLILGLKSALVTVSLGGILGFFGATSTVFALGAFAPFITAAAFVLVLGTGVIYASNRPKMSFKTAQNVIVEEITKYLFLPALILIKQKEGNFNKDLAAMLQVLKKQMTDIGSTQEYVEYFFNCYENMEVTEIEKVIANLNVSSDKLKKKMPGKGKLYSSDFDPVLYVDKAIELCNKFSKNYCDEVEKQKDNEKTIFHLKALLSADKPSFMSKTRDKIDTLRKAFVDKHVLNLQDAEEYARGLFVEPLIWFLRTPNLKGYWIQIIERKMENLGYSKEVIDKVIETYSAKTPEEILISVAEKYDFARSHGINTQVINKIVVYHCQKEAYIYCESAKAKEPSSETKLLDILKSNMTGKSVKI